MIRFASFGALALLGLLAATTATTTGCGGDDDSTEPEVNICTQVSFSSRGELNVPLRCNSINSQVSDIRYDQFSRPIAYNFNMSCTDGSQRFSGSVTSITWNNLGQALTMAVTVNGKSCSLTRTA